MSRIKLRAQGVHLILWGTRVVQVLILSGRLITKGEVQGWRRERQPFGHGQSNSLRTRATLGTADVASVEFLNSTVVYPVKGFSEFKIDSINLHSLVQLFAYVMKDWSNWAVVDLSFKNPNCLNLVLCCCWFDSFFIFLFILFFFIGSSAIRFNVQPLVYITTAWNLEQYNGVERCRAIREL